MKPIRVFTILITVLRYTCVCIVQLAMNISKPCGYSSGVAVTITKLHSAYKHIHNCTFVLVFYNGIIYQCSQLHSLLMFHTGTNCNVLEYL